MYSSSVVRLQAAVKTSCWGAICGYLGTKVLGLPVKVVFVVVVVYSYAERG